MKFKNNIKENEVTDEKLYKSRRDFIKSSAIASSGLLLGSSMAQAFEIGEHKSYDKYNIKNDEITAEKYSTTYNNFYEFSTSKEGPAKIADTLKPEPWKVEIAGHVEKPGTYDLDDILKNQVLEERIYRFRCVEAWSMVVPWLGFRLSDLIKQFKPTSKAKYVYFETLNDPEQLPGQYRRTIPWPYREGLRMDEAMNELTLMTVGMYGKKLPNQNGAPFRLIVPWKYGFKSIKSIVKIKFLETQPINSWQQIAANEYGFYANVNPKVDHPRWSQATERRIGGSFSLLRAVKDRNDGPLKDETLVRLFREIMSACLAQQKPLNIAYLGPQGTFSELATYQYFGHSVSAMPVTSIDQVFAEVEAGVADFGMVPVENSTEGAVNNTLDMFLSSPLKICGELDLPIHHNLMSRSKSLSDINLVYSHRQSLAQCRGWLNENMPGVECVAVSSNAEAARRSQMTDHSAAIAGESAATMYGLHILHKQIEDRADNSTRFLIIGKQILVPSGDDRTSLLVAAKDQPGALYHILKPLTECDVSMTRIESRPSKKGKWDYVFFIDVDGHKDDENMAKALRLLERITTQLKVLGSYPKSVS